MTNEERIEAVRLLQTTLRALDQGRVSTSQAMSKLMLVDHEICKRCGVGQYLAWSVKDGLWKRLGLEEIVLCLECFFQHCANSGHRLSAFDFTFFGIDGFCEAK